MMLANGHIANEGFFRWRLKGDPCALRASGAPDVMRGAVRVERGGARGSGGVAAHDKEESRAAPW
jgi:hypothetical protein